MLRIPVTLKNKNYKVYISEGFFTQDPKDFKDDFNNIQFEDCILITYNRKKKLTGYVRNGSNCDVYELFDFKNKKFICENYMDVIICYTNAMINREGWNICNQKIYPIINHHWILILSDKIEGY